MTDEAILRTMAGFSSIWDDGSHHSSRADAAKSYNFWGRRLTICLMAQPAVAQRLTGHKLAEDQGALGRILIHRPKSLIGDRITNDLSETETLLEGASDADVIDAVLSNFADVIKAGLRAPIQLDDRGDIRPKTLTIDKEGETMLREFGNEIERSMRRGQVNSDVQAFGSKAAEHAGRLAAVLQTYDTFAAQPVNYDHDEASRSFLPKMIDKTHVERGIALARFFLAETQRLSGGANPDEESADAAKLEVWLAKKHKTEVTLAEICRRGPNNLRTARRVRAAIAVLVENGRLRPKTGVEFEGARRREAWEVTPDHGQAPSAADFS
jgi:hypothetical protein